MNKPIAFLFFHYGKIPGYLSYAIEHVRVFNSDAEIHLITDSITDTSILDKFRIKKSEMGDYPSDELDRFIKVYHHLSSCNERYERFCFERWFVTETIRRKSPQKTYVLLDSDVALFASAHDLLSSLPDAPISICAGSPHFTFITGDTSCFLNFILDSYSDSGNLLRLMQMTEDAVRTGGKINLNDQEFLLMYMAVSQGMLNYESHTRIGFADANLHRTEGFDFLQLRRRPRKLVVWKPEEGRTIPYFKRGDELVRAFILHFQGPGKRVFNRFNSIDGPASSVQIWWWNQIFQKRWLANLM